MKFELEWPGKCSAIILKMVMDVIKGEDMSNSILFIVIGSSLVFVGLIAWKVLWLVKKINSAPVAEEAE
ncbi:MAG: hypothetical protein Q8L69_15125 [Gallionellaceae bacterium]|nr:hypothetical protein [Gallionellaceae bacterium]